MDTLQEISQWCRSLSQSEKRYVTLWGKAKAGSGGSQQLELFEHFIKAPADVPVPAHLETNLPTLLQRLKELLLDTLRVLDKHEGTGFSLHTQLQEVRLLLQRKLSKSAFKQLRKTEALAVENCRFDTALECCQLERATLMDSGRTDLSKDLALLQDKENRYMDHHRELLKLRQAHDHLRILLRKTSPGRSAVFGELVAENNRGLDLNHHWENSPWLLKSLAGSIMAMIEVTQGNAGSSWQRLSQLVTEWAAHPQRQMEETGLFLLLCKNYQNACFYHAQNPAEMESYLSLLPGFSHLPETIALDQQYLFYSSRVALLLSNANFTMLPVVRPEIVQWLKRESSRLNEAKTISLLFNLAVAEFLNENHTEANRLVNLLLQLPNRTVREDVRNFCRVFQAILHYELKNEELNEYLIRSGKRHYSRRSMEDQFEINVLSCLDKILHADSAQETDKALSALETALNHIRQKTEGKSPVVGLNETSLWVLARRQRQPLEMVYKQFNGLS